MNQIRILFLMLVFAIVAIPVSAQTMHQLSSADSSFLEHFRGKAPNQMVYDVWTRVCEMNRDQYPDSNKVMPQDVIFLPLGQYYVAKPGGKSHMWDAAVYFSNEVVTPYLNPTKPPMHHSVPADSMRPMKTETKADTDYTWLLYLLTLALIVWAMLIVIKSVKARTKQANPPFISPERIPSPKTATPEQVRPLVQEALGSTFGEKNYKIIGEIEDVLIKEGTLVSFWKDGTRTVKEYKNQDGYRALVEFLRSGKRSLVVLDARCFNPIYTAEHAEFSGTVIPKGKTQPEMIERITVDQVGDIGENIRRINRGEEVAVEPVVEQPPAAPVQEPSTAQEPPASEEKDPEISATELQISEGRVTVKGQIKMSFDQLMTVIREANPKKS